MQDPNEIYSKKHKILRSTRLFMRPTSRFIPNRIRLEVDPQAGEETGRLKRDAEIVIASSMKRDRNAVDGTWMGRRFFMVGGAESRVIIGCEADFWSRKPILKEERVRLMRLKSTST